MKHGKIILLIVALVFMPLILSCSGGGSSGGASKPPESSTDPADIVASVRYQIANISYSQSATVIAKIFDSNGNRVADGTAVRFSLNDVSLTAVAKELTQVGPVFSNGQSVYDTVTANGFASAIVSYQGVITNPCELAQVTIRPIGYIQVYENVEILFYSNASASYGLVLTVDDATLPGDGFSSTTIRAKIVNFFGQPAPILTTVNFSTSPSDVGSLNATSVPTDDNGEAAVIFTSTQVADPISVLITAEATISVNCGVASLRIPVTDIASIGLTPQEIGTIVVTAVPSTIYTYGIEDDDTTPSNSTVTAIVNDVNGFPLIQNTLVKFTSLNRDTGDSIGIIEAFALTDENGVATVQLKAGQVGGIAEITAKDSAENVSGTAYVVIRSGFSLECDPPDGTIGTEYFYDFSACVGENAVEPFTFEIVSLDTQPPAGFTEGLPTGLALVEGILLGTPTTAGSFIFKIQGSDAFGSTDEAIYVITITDPEEGALQISPTSGEFTSGTAKSLAFQASGGTGSYSFTFNIGVEPAGAFSTDAGGATAIVSYDGSNITDPGFIVVTLTSGDESVSAVIDVKN